MPRSRPPIGPIVPIRMGEDLKTAIQTAARSEGVSLARWVRDACKDRLITAAQQPIKQSATQHCGKPPLVG